MNMKAVNYLRSLFPKGTVLVLDYMDDIQASEPGTKGVVEVIDDMGTIHVKWETASSLGLIPHVDRFHKINE